MTTTTAPTTSTTPTSSTAANILSGQQSLSQDYTTFLTLLTTQLQNQDPTSPLDTNAFTQQLVSMTGVQQQLLTNQLLQQMATASTNGSVANAVDLIGANVTAANSSEVLSGGSAAWTYNLASAASAATITISNSTGQTIYSTTVQNPVAGNNAFTWNGQNFSGSQLPDGGTYTMAVQAADGSGAPITSTVSISGVVGSVSQSASGTTQVNIGATPVPLTSITSVTKPSSSSSSS
jgi:flagellar basal-body rod modification protein FlgD